MRAEYILSDEDDNEDDEENEDNDAGQRHRGSSAGGCGDLRDSPGRTAAPLPEIDIAQPPKGSDNRPTEKEDAPGIAAVVSRPVSADSPPAAVPSPLPPLRGQCETPAKPQQIAAEPPLTVAVDAPAPPPVSTVETDASLSVHSSLSSSFPLHSSQPPSATSAQASAALMYLSSSSETGGLLSAYHQQQQALQRRREAANAKRSVDWDAKSRRLETLVAPHLPHDALVRQLWERWQELHALRRAAIDQQQRRQQPPPRR